MRDCSTALPNIEGVEAAKSRIQAAAVSSSTTCSWSSRESGLVVWSRGLVWSGASRLRLLNFVVSVRGALGSEAQTFIRQLSARVARAVPYTGCWMRRAGRSPSQHVGRSLPASVGAPAPPRRPSTLSAATTSPPLTRRAASTVWRLPFVGFYIVLGVFDGRITGDDVARL